MNAQSRFLVPRTLALLVVLAAAAPAETTGKAARDFARTQAHLEKGRMTLAKLEEAVSDAPRLQILDRALYFLRRARALAIANAEPEFRAVEAEITPLLVDTLNRQTAIYYGRKSLPLAKKRNAEALALAPKDKPALALAAAIEKADKEDIYESVTGLVAIDRVRARRLAMGVPLRDRGLARRR